MAKKKNLTKADLQDVSIYEASTQKTTNGRSTKTSLSDIPIKINCLTEKQKDLKKAIETTDIIVSSGPAGTGKTYLALLVALNLLKNNPMQYQRIVLVKSLVTIKGEEVGFLPGTLWEKLEPFMYSFTGNLDKIFKSAYTTKIFRENGIIEFQPIAYVRGVTIDNAIVIIDETQNMNMHTFKSLITRIGYNSKFIFLGDTDQIDMHNPKQSCLKRVVAGFAQKEICSGIHFTNEDIVRNPLIGKILDIIKEIETTPID